MTRIEYHPPAVIPQITGVHHGLCQVCLMFAKGDQVARTRDVWEPLVHDGKTGEVKRIPYEEKTVINEAVTVGVCDLLPGVLLELCWTHLGALAPPDSREVCKWCHGSGRKQGPALDVARGPLPPGLNGGGIIKGRG